MPAPIWTEQDFTDFYGGNKLLYDPNHALYGQDLGVGYNRYRYSSRVEYEHHATLINTMRRFGWTTSDRTFFVGCYFGYGMAQARDQGALAGNIWGCDNSLYVHTNKTTEADPRFADIRVTNILDVDFLNISNLILTTANAPTRYDFVIGENVDEGIALADRGAWFAKYNSLLAAQGTVIHFVDVQTRDETGQLIPAPQLWIDKGLTWQTLEEWSALETSHIWIATNAREFVATTPPASRLRAIVPGA